MPIMLRTNDKCQKISDALLGKKHKKIVKDSSSVKKSDRDKRLDFEETSSR